MTKISKGLCQCGCGKKTNIATYNRQRYGWVKGEPIRFINNHDKKNLGPQYSVNEKSGCWEWLKGKTSAGYPHFIFKGKMVYAHRHYYEKYNGPIPERFVIDHLCKNSGCVNPRHLEAVTNAENVRRGNKAILEKQDVYAIRQFYENGEKDNRELAEMFGVSRDHIRGILSYEVWNVDI